MKSRKMKAVLAIGATMFLAACSGGGDSPSALPAAAPLVGTVIDSPVQGLHYTTQPSGLFGVTDAQGHYNYRSGDAVVFDIGGRAIGHPVPGAPVITPLQIFAAISITDVRVVNLAQLLLGLGTVSTNNVIQLPAAFPATLPNPLDFASPSFDTDLGAAGITLASEPTANTHLQAQFSTVSVVLAGAGTGTVTSAPSGLTCSSGTCSAMFPTDTSVTLTATRGFAGWSGGTGNASGCATGACAFTLTGDSSVTATFNVPPPLLNFAGTYSGTYSLVCADCDGGHGESAYGSIIVTVFSNGDLTSVSTTISATNLPSDHFGENPGFNGTVSPSGVITASSGNNPNGCEHFFASPYTVGQIAGTGAMTVNYSQPASSLECPAVTGTITANAQ